ncbi:multifunctional CCA tRNA nucleotidyl transferase/2'3'-cyclic phosphodiesterase/2'nucleotidase/phosphatase, partial [Vibrio sp. 03_296]
AQDRSHSKIFNKLDVWRKAERLNDILLCCQADHAGRQGLQDHPYPQAERIQLAYQAALSVEVQSVIQDGFKGPAIRDEQERRRIEAVKAALLNA